MKNIYRRSGSKTATAASLLLAVGLAGCSGDSGVGGGLFQTGAVTPVAAPVAAPPAAPAVDPMCVSLNQQIETLRRDGVHTKVENAAAKKYKLTAADIAKADQLNKANADFNAKCGPKLPSTAAVATPGQGTVVPVAAVPAAAQPVAKAKAKAKAVATQSGVTVAPKQ
jgi:hypothetical protein